MPETSGIRSSGFQPCNCNLLRKATQRVCHENSDRLDQAVKLNSLHQNPDGANSEREIESLLQGTNAASNLRDRLSKVWLLQSEFTEALATLSLKIPPAHRADEEFNTMVNSGNDLKVV
jgi:hypothetical protein